MITNKFSQFSSLKNDRRNSVGTLRHKEKKEKEKKEKRREEEKKRERKEREREKKREKREKRREKMSRVNYYQSAFNSQFSIP